MRACACVCVRVRACVRAHRSPPISWNASWLIGSLISNSCPCSGTLVQSLNPEYFTSSGPYHTPAARDVNRPSTSVLLSPVVVVVPYQAPTCDRIGRVLRCNAVCRAATCCAAARCSVLDCVDTRCTAENCVSIMLQRDAPCCSKRHWVATSCAVLQHAATRPLRVYCVLQCYE